MSRATRYQIAGVQDKFLSTISQPYKSKWIPAEDISNRLEVPLEVIIKLICIFSDEGLINGVRDRKTGRYYVQTIWQRPRRRELSDGSL